MDECPRAAVRSAIPGGANRHRLEPWAYVKHEWMTLSVNPERVEDLRPIVGTGANRSTC